MTNAAEQALRDLLFTCLHAQAHGVPLPSEVDHATMVAEAECEAFGDAEYAEISKRLKL